MDEDYFINGVIAVIVMWLLTIVALIIYQEAKKAGITLSDAVYGVIGLVISCILLLVIVYVVGIIVTKAYKKALEWKKHLE